MLQALRLLHTVRHLRPEQVVDRLTRPVRTRWTLQAVRRMAEEAFPGLRSAGKPSFVPPIAAGRDPLDLLSGVFTYVGHTETVGWPPDWEREAAPALWQYHLHYGDELWALSPRDARLLVADWIDRYPARPGRPGWGAFPTSIRLVNWVMVLFFRDVDETLEDRGFCERMWHSMRQQTRVLSALRERHLLANHLLENAVALTFVGSVFRGREAAGWRRIGLDLLRAQLPEQVLSDGIHFERSPMYQCRLLQALLNLSLAADEEVQSLVSPYVRRMAHGLAALTHPDGRIALLNDSAWGVHPSPPMLLSAAGGMTLPAGPIGLPVSGFYGHRSEKGSYVIANAGRIRPDYFPAHSHADLFSFEWSLAGERFLTDTGVHDYERSPMRAYCRSTAAHNTVEIDGANQTDVWAAFRVGRRARPHDVRWEETAGGYRLSAWHDGYLRTAARARHERTFFYLPDRSLRIADRIDARHAVSIHSRLHFAPECTVEPEGEKSVRVTRNGIRVIVRFVGEGRLLIGTSPLCGRFYSIVERPAVTWQASGRAVASDIECTVLD